MEKRNHHSYFSKKELIHVPFRIMESAPFFVPQKMN